MARSRGRLARGGGGRPRRRPRARPGGGGRQPAAEAAPARDRPRRLDRGQRPHPQLRRQAPQDLARVPAHGLPRAAGAARAARPRDRGLPLARPAVRRPARGARPARSRLCRSSCCSPTAPGRSRRRRCRMRASSPSTGSTMRAASSSSWPASGSCSAPSGRRRRRSCACSPSAARATPSIWRSSSTTSTPRAPRSRTGRRRSSCRPTWPASCCRASTRCRSRRGVRSRWQASSAGSSASTR